MWMWTWEMPAQGDADAALVDASEFELSLDFRLLLFDVFLLRSE